MRSILGAIILMLAVDQKVADRLYDSSVILDELVKAPDSAIPKDLLKRAQCVAVIPAVKKAAIGIGGEYGRGAVSCRKGGEKGTFGAPSMIMLGGGSFGLQIGGQSTDVVMLFMTPESYKTLLRDKITIGADVSAAGPIGRAASAETDATLRAEILTYARSRGLFAGIALNGATLRPDKDANKDLYGKRIEAKDLLENSNVAVPGPAQKFLDSLRRSAPGN